jgi:MFS family permease
MFGNRTIFREAPRPEAVRLSPRAPWLAVGVVCFGAFMGQLDASIVTLTFRPMEREFGAPLAAVQWVSLVYLLVLVALLVPAGRVADAVGRKLVYGYGFAVFTVASAACGLAPSLPLLVVFRLAQAAGAAMLQANSVALVTTSVPPGRMRLALGIQAGAQALGLGLGPALGGVLTQTATWRAVYWINVPVGCAAVLASRYLLPRTRQLIRTDAFDWPGAALLAACSTALLLALSVAGGLPLPGWASVALAAAASAAGALFARRELRAAFPLVPSSLLRSARLGLALTGAFLGYLTLFGPLVLVPQVLTSSAGETLRAGLILTALPVGFGVAAVTGEVLLPHRMSTRARGAAGATLSTVALAALAVLPRSPGLVVLLLAVTGAGLGVFVPVNNAMIMRTDRSAGLLGGLVNMARGLGTTFGIALVTLALHVAGAGGHPGTGWAAALALLAAAAAGATATMLKAPRPSEASGAPG